MKAPKKQLLKSLQKSPKKKEKEVVEDVYQDYLYLPESSQNTQGLSNPQLPTPVTQKKQDDQNDTLNFSTTEYQPHNQDTTSTSGESLATKLQKRSTQHQQNAPAQMSKLLDYKDTKP